MLISEAEAVVMNVLWAGAPEALGTDEIVRALSGQQAWKPATIKTLLGRLLRKGAIGAEADGRRFLYSPILERQEWLAEQSVGLLDRLFDGRLAPLVSHLAAHRKLKRSDVEALKKLLADYERGRG
jgi:BlaI family transcriptional regulator, penicillinase repressor